MASAKLKCLYTSVKFSQNICWHIKVKKLSLARARLSTCLSAHSSGGEILAAAQVVLKKKHPADS